MTTFIEWCVEQNKAATICGVAARLVWRML
jgi:hypothetical protein